MKKHQGWLPVIGNGHIMPGPRHRSQSKKPMWIIVLVSLVCLSLIGAYVYPPRRFSACYFLSSSVCSPFMDWLPPAPARIFTDEEIAARVVFQDILSMPSVQSKNAKIAFMFLTPGSLPFEKLWEKFFLVWFSIFDIFTIQYALCTDMFNASFTLNSYVVILALIY